jgi:predicted porin
VDYKSIGLPLGIRHYFFLQDASAVFINASYRFDFALSSKITFASNYNSLDIKSPMGAIFGVGYRFKKKFAVEVQYAVKRNILQHYYYWTSEYKTVSLVFGYNLF